MSTPNSCSLAVAVLNNDLNAKALAEQLSLPSFNLKSPLKFVTEFDYLLIEEEGVLSIAKTGKGAPKPVSVELASGAVDHRRKFGGGKGQDIAKAVGLSKRADFSVIDGTAGLGRDGFVLASLGCNVTLHERVGFVRAMLENGLERARLVLDVEDIIGRLRLATGTIYDLPDEEVTDVVYLDPMFPHNDKSSAAVKKEMAFFRDLVGGDNDADALLPKAWGVSALSCCSEAPQRCSLSKCSGADLPFGR